VLKFANENEVNLLASRVRFVSQLRSTTPMGTELSCVVRSKRSIPLVWGMNVFSVSREPDLFLIADWSDPFRTKKAFFSQCFVDLWENRLSYQNYFNRQQWEKRVWDSKDTKLIAPNLNLSPHLGVETMKEMTRKGISTTEWKTLLCMENICEEISQIDTGQSIYLIFRPRLRGPRQAHLNAIDVRLFHVGLTHSLMLIY